MNNLYLLQYQNYYNRMVDKPKSLSIYRGYMCQPKEVDDINPCQLDFIPGDGVFTEAIINWNGEHPDYVIITENNSIISRWYVVESSRTRGGQYQMKLFRDLFADYYDQIMAAPAFIEKGYVPSSDPAIFNAEGMTFNQIKQNETLLKDKTKSAWIVGYVAEYEAPAAGEQDEKPIEFGGIPDVAYEVADLEDWEYYEVYNNGVNIIDSKSISYTVYANLTYGGYESMNSHAETTFNSTGNIGVNLLEGKVSLTGYETPQEDTSLLNQYKATSSTDTAARNQIGYKSYSYTPNQISKLADRIIKVGTGDSALYYRIIPAAIPSTKSQYVGSGTNLFTNLSTIISNGITIGDRKFNIITGKPDGTSFKVNYIETACSINLQPITLSTGFTATLRKDRPILLDAPYCMFCIPFGENYNVKFGNYTYKVEQLNSFALAMGIATSLGGLGENTKIYDLQLLPYCPIPLVREAGPTINLTTGTTLRDNIIFDWHDESNTIIYWAKESTGSFDIIYNQYIDETNPIQFKINALTRFQRLCSPNYNGVFEFSIEKNNGTEYINVDYTYKPHQPYIHLNPNFRRLYGSDFNDARGLICGGDFSLPVVMDSWVNYQISNKNFNEIFNRQITNMETTNRIAKEKEAWQIAAGTVSGTASGAMTGFAMGGGAWGAIAGGVLGGMSSLGTGIMDRHYNELLRNEAIDYTKDLFGFQNQNIQALPDALTKVSSFNANNKIFPFIERYITTPQEEKALENKLIYNGMTIGRIGTLEQYYTNKPAKLYGQYGYFKGQLIRIENINEDSHVANAIAQEFNKGWYII